MNSEIESHRQEIDQIDDQVLKLLNERARHAIQIGKLKKDQQDSFHAPEREHEIYNRLEQDNSGPFPTEAIRHVFREIISASLALEEPLKVSYLGPTSTFTHMACMQKFGFSALYVPVNSIREVFNTVERDRADYGVVPIENSTEGVVNSTLDMFVDSPLKISGEILQEVSHHLLSKTGRLEEVKKIYSHPHAIAQCRVWLENALAGVPLLETTSTARAAEICLEDPTTGAIASEVAAKLYGLQFVQRRIEDNINNFTRFLIIAKKSPDRTGTDKTSVMFSIKDRVGALLDMLKPFSGHEINLTKIESRPTRKKAWEYIFYVDLIGHVDEENVLSALEALKKNCVFLKVLGSYPVAN